VGSRVDDHGRAYKKSQLQIQIAVNRHRVELDQELLSRLPTLAALDPVLDWRSPLEDDKFREYYDAGLLDRIGRPELKDKLAAFWPKGGPHWDAVAVARSKTGAWLGPVLVEAKSYPEEMRSHCGASDEDARSLIRMRLAETRAWLGVSKDDASAWWDEYYQAANRLSFLRFFSHVLEEDAWLANVLVLDDPRASTTQAQWDTAIAEVAARLGLREGHLPNAAYAFIPGRQRQELL
jgi:hypothetical protein